MNGLNELPWVGQLINKNNNCKPHDEVDTLKRTIAHPPFQEFAKKAYESTEGYAIRINPDTQKKEMFIAGNRFNLKDWALTFYEGGLHQLGVTNDLFISILNPWRFNKQNTLGQIATNEGVDIVYGHSRGGAIVADMPLHECTQRVGLDAAMLIASNKNMLNLYEGGGINPIGAFDEMIGKTGQQNITVDFSPLIPHKVWKV